MLFESHILTFLFGMFCAIAMSIGATELWVAYINARTHKSPERDDLLPQNRPAQDTGCYCGGDCGQCGDATPTVDPREPRVNLGPRLPYTNTCREGREMMECMARPKVTSRGWECDLCGRDSLTEGLESSYVKRKPYQKD